MKECPKCSARNIVKRGIRKQKQLYQCKFCLFKFLGDTVTNSIKLLAKLTTQSKQIDGMGFGGAATDKLEVAGALGMPNPNTGKKISNEAYQMARFVYVHDKVCGIIVKDRINAFAQKNKGGIKEATALLISKAALAEFIQPNTIINKEGQRSIIAKTNAELSNDIGIRKQSFTASHSELFNKCFAEISIWSQDAISHLNATMDNQEAA